MAKTQVLNLKGEKVKDLTLKENVWATEVNEVVMHDAMGVRLETGKQAKVINEMTELMEKLSGTELSNEEKLKEFVGHTPLQVVMGSVLGIVVALVLHFWF